MKHISTRLLGAGLASALLLPSLTAQMEVLALDTSITHGIPTDLGSEGAKRLIAFDADGDLVQDYAVLWGGGQLVMTYAPENLGTLMPCPAAVARDATRIAAAFAPAEAAGRDGLLVSEDLGIFYHYLVQGPPEQNLPGQACAIVKLPVTYPPLWQGSSKLEAYVRGANLSCAVVALDPDQLTVRVGEWDSGAIQEQFSVYATAPVQQVMFVDFLHNGVLHVVARTTTGLHIWDLTGNLVLTTPATLPSWNGAICTVRNGSKSEVAWASVTSSNWTLRRIYHSGTALVATAGSAVTVPAGQASRFRVVGLSPITVAGSDQEDLLLEQNTFPASLLLRRNDMGTVDEADDIFSTHATISTPGLVPNQDNCPSIVGDLVRDAADSGEEIVSVRTMARTISISSLASSLPPDPMQLIGVDSKMTWASIADHTESIELSIALPQQYGSHLNVPATPNLAVQVTAWPQGIGNPNPLDQSLITNFAPSPCSPASTNTYFMCAPGQVAQKFQVPLRLPEAAWSSGNAQAYLLVRIVQFANAPTGTTVPAIAWATESQMVGLAGNQHADFMLAIRKDSVQGDATAMVFGGEPRDPGVMVHRGRVTPPPATLPIPIPAKPVIVQQPPPQQPV